MRSEVIQYLKLCYQADNRHQSLWDIFSKNGDHLTILSEADTRHLQVDGTFAIKADIAKAQQS